MSSLTLSYFLFFILLNKSKFIDSMHIYLILRSLLQKWLRSAVILEADGDIPVPQCKLDESIVSVDTIASSIINKVLKIMANFLKFDPCSCNGNE